MTFLSKNALSVSESPLSISVRKSVCAVWSRTAEQGTSHWEAESLPSIAIAHSLPYQLMWAHLQPYLLGARVEHSADASRLQAAALSARNMHSKPHK